jgi:putative phosphoesterase
MRIAVFSDTHDRLPPGLAERMRGADEIWHLGDVCAPDVLEDFLAIAEVVVVQGNCDEDYGWPLALELEREGVKFYLTHIPPTSVPAGTVAVLHGHTHVPRDETVGGVRWLNPGCITRPRGDKPASFAWLTVADAKVTSWELVRV